MEMECESHECEVEMFTCQRGSPTPNHLKIGLNVFLYLHIDYYLPGN